MASRHPAAVVTLTRSGSPFHRSSPPHRSSAERLLGQLAQARAAGLPVLLRGERGTGKTTLARSCHDLVASPEQLAVVDCALSAVSPHDWAQRLGAAVAAVGGDPANTIILQHLDALDPALVTSAEALIAPARAWLVATAPAGGLSHAPLAERFSVVVDVPPLRDRAGDIPALVTEIIARLHPQAPRPRCTPEVLTALAAADWPGNIRQLRQVVATALIRSMSCDVTVGDLPGGYPGTVRGRHVTGLERAEREALLTALREADWDREAAARDLGISRATIYRKLKRLKVTAPLHGQPAAKEACQ